MKYVRLRIATPSGTPLYEKDVELRDAFEGYIRRLVSDLVHASALNEGDKYSVVVKPRYTETMSAQPTLRLLDDVPPTGSRWLDMDIDPPAMPFEPVRYFTFALCAPERKLFYSCDVRTLEIGHDFVRHGVEQALIRLGVLKSGDIYRPTFFACDDDRANFERESIPGLRKEAASLVEFVADESRPSFERRHPAVYGDVEAVGAPEPDAVRVYLQRAALEQLQTEARVSLKAERGGMLVGQVFEAEEGGGWLVEVSALTVSEDASSNLAQFTFNFESWLKHSQEMRERFPGRRVVGWYHTHLLETTNTSADGTVQKTRLFFSRDDVFTQKKFFNEEWYVALVLDPDDGHVFFRMRDGEVVPVGGYCLFDHAVDAAPG